MSNEGVIVGIDLGTTYSSISYINQLGKAEIIPNREGERITPSVVLFDSDTPLVGTIAKRSAVASPLNICQFVKRQMGDKNWCFLAEDNSEYTAEEVSALILRRLKEDAETMLGYKICNAVITVPAYFNDSQRKATQDAGKIAGLNVIRVINEPTAAAIAYGLNQEVDQTVMVYDLGGGTFDVTIMHMAENNIDVVATGGDKNLGGFDWDNRIMEYLNEEFQKAGGPDLFEDLASQQDLRDKAEIAKKTLSSRDNTKVFLSGGGKNISISLSREKFDNISADLLDRTKMLMEMTLEDAKIGWLDIDKILMVGGSTRMKAVPELIAKVSGKIPSAELHPDEVVAVGAALLGGILQKQQSNEEAFHLEGLPNVHISDVTSHSLGVVAQDSDTKKMYNSIILAKDTKYRTRIGNTYATVVDKQEGIKVEVTEGEGENLEYVRILGESSMDIPPYPKDSPIEVYYTYDDDGIIHVEVYDGVTDKLLGEMHIEREANLTLSEVKEKVERISKLEIQ